MNKLKSLLLLSLLIGLTSCSRQAEPPALNRFNNPKYKEQLAKRQQLCALVTVVPGRAIDNDMRIKLFNCLNYDGSLNELEPLITDNELFDSLNSVLANGNSGTFKDVFGQIDEEKIIQLLPFMSEILRRNVITNIVPVVSKVVSELSEHEVLNPMLPTITSMFEGDYFEFTARSSSAAISSGAMGTLMKRASHWLLAPQGDTLVYKALLNEAQGIFREREKLTPLLPFSYDVFTSGAIGAFVQGPYPDPKHEPNRLKDLLTHKLDPLVKLLDTVHAMNRPNNRFIQSIKLTFLHFESKIKEDVIDELRKKFIERVHGAMVDDIQRSDLRRFITEKGYSYDNGRLKVREILNLFFCYFDTDATNSCPNGFLEFIYDKEGLRHTLDQFDKDLGNNENYGHFLNELEAGFFIKLQDDYTGFMKKYLEYYAPDLDQEVVIGELTEEFLNNFSVFILDENKTMNQLLYDAWDDALWKYYYKVDLGFLEIWGQIVDKIKSLEFDSSVNIAEAVIELMGKSPPSQDGNQDSILKTIFRDFKLVEHLEETICKGDECKTAREWIVDYYLPLVREVPGNPNSPPAWSAEDIDFTHTLLKSLPAIEVLIDNGAENNGKLLHAFYLYNDRNKYPLFKDLVAAIEFTRQEELIQNLKPLIISAIDNGVLEAFFMVDQGCQDSPFVCWSKKVFATQGLFDLIRPQKDNNLETALINNLIQLIRATVDKQALPLTGEFIRVSAQAIEDIPIEELNRFLKGMDDLLAYERLNVSSHPLGKFIRELGGMIERKDFQRLVRALDRINGEGNLQPMLNFLATQVDNGNAEKILRFAFRLIQEMDQ